MKRLAVAIALLLCGVAPAMALERAPVCREASVVDEMTREIQAQSYYSTVDPALVTEQPTASANVVRCDVCVRTAPYDMTRFADRPIRHCVGHGFEVRILHDGFLVHDLE